MSRSTFRTRMAVFGVTGLAAAALLAVGTANSQSPPFGGDDDIAYSQQLWSALTEAKLVGDGAIKTKPYEGGEPHGFVLETLYGEVTVAGHTGTVIVKRNYGPEGLTPEEVANDADEDNRNIFWVKYLGDGSLDKNPKGMQLAGRVAKGADVGCIACHSGADGDDYEFLRNM